MPSILPLSCMSTDSGPVLNTWDAEVAEGMGMLQSLEAWRRRQVHKQLTVAAKPSKQWRDVCARGVGEPRGGRT